jgi:hypothetical protein
MQVGAAVVLAVTTALIASGGPDAATPEAALDAFRPGLGFAAVVSIAGALVAASALVPWRRRRHATEPDPAASLDPEYASPATDASAA